MKYQLPLPTVYNCEIGFSALVGLKGVKKNRLNGETELRLKLFSIQRDVTVTGQRLQSTPFFSLKSKAKKKKKKVSNLEICKEHFN